MSVPFLQSPCTEFNKAHSGRNPNALSMMGSRMKRGKNDSSAALPGEFAQWDQADDGLKATVAIAKKEEFYPTQSLAAETERNTTAQANAVIVDSSASGDYTESSSSSSSSSGVVAESTAAASLSVCPEEAAPSVQTRGSSAATAAAAASTCNELLPVAGDALTATSETTTMPTLALPDFRSAFHSNLSTCASTGATAAAPIVSTAKASVIVWGGGVDSSLHRQMPTSVPLAANSYSLDPATLASIRSSMPAALPPPISSVVLPRTPSMPTRPVILPPLPFGNDNIAATLVSLPPTSPSVPNCIASARSGSEAVRTPIGPTPAQTLDGGATSSVALVNVDQPMSTTEASRPTGSNANRASGTATQRQAEPAPALMVETSARPRRTRRMPGGMSNFLIGAAVDKDVDYNAKLPNDGGYAFARAPSAAAEFGAASTVANVNDALSDLASSSRAESESITANHAITVGKTIGGQALPMPPLVGSGATRKATPAAARRGRRGGRASSRRSTTPAVLPDREK